MQSKVALYSFRKGIKQYNRARLNCPCTYRRAEKLGYDPSYGSMQVADREGGCALKATDYIARFLYSRGVRTVFELPGGMTTHLLNSIYEFQLIRILSVHHEQAAAFCADATGRLTGVPGVAMATSGPGAINLLTGIGSCYFDSSPAVFITGQVNRWELRGDRAIRQLGFQETDIV
jgi:thiamine pyrophosphate-dependent acetolactate synthase large subunit-like protein